MEWDRLRHRMEYGLHTEAYTSVPDGSVLRDVIDFCTDVKRKESTEGVNRALYARTNTEPWRGQWLSVYVVVIYSESGVEKYLK